MQIFPTVITDNTNGWRLSRSHNTRQRTVNVRFEELSSGSRDFFYVTAWGNALPDDGSGQYSGKLDLDGGTVRSAIMELLEKWQDLVLNYSEASIRGGQPLWPYASKYDLSRLPDHENRLNNTMRQLARAGSSLFELLFFGGDVLLRQLGTKVSTALRTGKQVVSFHSDTLFVPWWLLYLPPDSTDNMDAVDNPWSWDGFLGYSHLIEHNFTRTPEWRACIRIGEASATCGANVDRTIDEQYRDFPFIAPILNFLEVKTTLSAVRESKGQLGNDLRSTQFRDQLVYFGCHGVGPGDPKKAGLMLSDKEPIRTMDFIRWLSQTPFRFSPLVFVNACQGGQMSAFFYTAFGRVLLERGANCLVGPQIDIPPDFAREYARQLLERLFRGTRLGDAVHELARTAAKDWRNPLGLAISLYRGLDTHFCPVGEKSVTMSRAQPALTPMPLQVAHR